MLNNKLELSPAMQDLILEKCPQAVQVMPPVDDAAPKSLFWSVCGNVVMGIVLLTTLLLLPVFLAGFV